MTSYESGTSSQHIGSVREHELILNRSGLPHYLASKQLLWICAKHRHDMGKNWRPCRTCMPLTVAFCPKKELKTRNVGNIVMSSKRTKLDSTATFCDKYSIKAFFSELSLLVNQTINYPNQKRKS